jgi:hypothetical protein
LVVGFLFTRASEKKIRARFCDTSHPPGITNPLV